MVPLRNEIRRLPRRGPPGQRAGRPVQAGSLHAILFNWEVRPENHFYLGEHGVVTTPRLLVRGTEHDVRIRSIGPGIDVSVDRQLVYRGHGQLAGTVTVYPALGSEIFVSEIAVDGELAPETAVHGPTPPCR